MGVTDAGGNALDAASRLEALRSTRALDTPAEETFDRLTRLAARLLRAPVALVSLVDADRQFFKSCVGLPEPWRSARQTPLSHSFCQHAVTSGQPLIIGDARQHPLVRDNLAIADLGVVAYAGIPLRSASGEVLGSFCVIDTSPREWTGEELETLHALAASAAAELELRRAAAEQQAQREVAERERSLTLALLESSRDGIYGLDAAGRCTFINHAAARMLGFDPAELVGQDLRQLIGLRTGGAATDGSPREAAPFVCGDGEMRRRDGSTLTVAYSSAPMEQAGAAAGVVVTFSDVTERRQAEKALRQTNFILRAVVDGSSDAIFVKDQSGRYVMINAAGAAIVGKTVDQIIGSDDTHLFDPDTAARIMFADRLILRTGQSQTIEHAYTPLGGGEVVLQTFKAPYRDDAGNVVGVIGIARDVTRRKRAEDALKQAKEQAESANRAKDQFLAVLSHELRSPLAPVLALASAWEQDPAVPAAMREDLSMIRRNVELEVRLIDDLLDLTRISKGKLRLSPVLVDAHTIVRHAMRTYPRSELVRRQLSLETRLAATRSVINADPGRFQQVLWNLLNNAIKFTPDGGRITLRSWDAPEDRLAIEVADTGIGIDPQHLPHIFDAFQQGEDQVTHRFGGLGLGLAICKALIGALGGEITAASNGPGKGATFTLVLPVCAAAPDGTDGEAPSGDSSAPAHVPTARPLRILLVEDHADTSRAMSRLLRRIGHEVRTAGTVRAAVDAARDGPIDLVISDLGLPDGTGHDVMRQLRPLGAMRGIALSGYGSEEDIRKSHDAGFDTHLTKPTDFQRLLETIEQLSM